MSLPQAVVVWACETCGSYFASSSVGDLRKEYNYDKKGKPTFPRARCPTQSCVAKDIQRIPIVISLGSDTSESEPREEDSVHWSSQFCEVCGKRMIETDDVLVCSGCAKVRNKY